MACAAPSITISASTGTLVPAGNSSASPISVARTLSVPIEDSNFLRLYLLIKKIGTKVCYEIFHRYFSKNPKILYQQLLPYKKILKPFLFQNQFDLIYGDTNQETDSRSFDVTLLLLLIRKTCPLVQKPKKGKAIYSFLTAWFHIDSKIFEKPATKEKGMFLSGPIFCNRLVFQTAVFFSRQKRANYERFG